MEKLKGLLTSIEQMETTDIEQILEIAVNIQADKRKLQNDQDIELSGHKDAISNIKAKRYQEIEYLSEIESVCRQKIESQMLSQSIKSFSSDIHGSVYFTEREDFEVEDILGFAVRYPELLTIDKTKIRSMLKQGHDFGSLLKLNTKLSLTLRPK